jgi:DNA-directed RNA polymerase subunit K/omega
MSDSENEVDPESADEGSYVEEDEEEEQLAENADEDEDKAEDEFSGPMHEGSDTNEDEDVEETFQKFESNANYIRDVHPEILGINHEEIEALSHVIYNEHGIIEDPLHKGIPILTKYEHARVLGARAAQIDNGAPLFITVDSSVMDSYLLAQEELKQKKIPFIIRRPMPNGKFEIWKLESLENIY